MIPSVSDKKAYFSRAQPPPGCTLSSTRTGSIPGEAGESNMVWEQEMMFSQLVKRSPWWAPDNLLQ